MRKMLSRPVVFSALASTLLLHDEGRVISNAPMNEAANTTRRAQKKRLKTALVLRALSALGPKMALTRVPRST